MIDCVCVADVSDMAEQVYMEVIVGEDESAANQDSHLDESPNNKMFVPVSWAAACGKLIQNIPWMTHTAHI